MESTCVGELWGNPNYLSTVHVSIKHQKVFAIVLLNHYQSDFIKVTNSNQASREDLYFLFTMYSALAVRGPSNITLSLCILLFTYLYHFMLLYLLNFHCLYDFAIDCTFSIDLFYIRKYKCIAFYLILRGLFSKFY